MWAFALSYWLTQRRSINQWANRAALSFQHILHHSTRFRPASRCSDWLIWGSFMKKGLVIKITRESSRAFLGGQMALTTIVTPDYSLMFILCFCCPTTTITFPENTLQYFSGECPQPLLHSHHWSGLQNLLRITLSSICLLVQSKEVARG